MAEEDEDVNGEEGAEGGEGGEGGGGKKKLLIIIVAVLLLVVGGLAAAYFTGLLDPVIEMISGEPSQDGAPAEGGDGAPVKGQPVFYDLQEMLINLNTGGRKSTFLKITISLEMEKQTDIPRLESVMPRVIDNFQTFLRELRIEDLKGSQGIFRLREELLKRVSAAVAPIKIKDVLFKEMLVQ